MSEFERDIKEIRESIKRIERALGIGPLTPASVMKINRKAMQDAEAIRERKHVGKTEGQ